MAVAGVVGNCAPADGTLTFEFGTAPGDQTAVGVVYRPKDASYS
jgi:hypothetical protein